MSGTTELKGEILFEGGVPLLSKATVRVQLQDVTRVDASSRLVAEQVRAGVSCQPGSDQSMRFNLDIPRNLDEKAFYTLHVHVDRDGSGVVSTGDYITMQSYPVSSRDVHKHFTIVVRQVR